MNWEAIYHIDDVPYAFPVRPDAVKVRIRAKRGDVRKANVLHSDRYVAYRNEMPQELELVASTASHDYFEGVIVTETKRIRYVFQLEDGEGNSVWFGELGASPNRDMAGVFNIPYVSPSEVHELPEWVYDAVVYQIFPDRFRNGDESNDPPGTEPWTPDASPSAQSYYGGDLAGITEKLPYLQELGINLLYLTPVFVSPSTHKYDTTDYLAIDPHFGDIGQLKALVDEAHMRGIRVMLDAVFNHSGNQFFAFRDVVEKGEASRYKEWFFAERFPVVESPVPNYVTFGNAIATMPKLNTANEELKQYLLDVAAYWIRETGIDGWRLDVANEVDRTFWRDFRRAVKSEKPDALIVGEIMHHSGPWLRGDQFDGVMNYMLRTAMVDFFAKTSIGVREFSGRLSMIRMMYTDAANAAMFNLIGSHDTERFMTMCERHGFGWGEEKAVKEKMMLAVFFQMIYPGIPQIYYGDEVGMRGGEDPECRRPMLWQEEQQDGELLAFYRKVIALRRQYAALRRGKVRVWLEEESLGVLGIVRDDGTQRVAALINNSPLEAVVSAGSPFGSGPSGFILDAMSGVRYPHEGRLQLSLPPYGCALLCEE
ncbi:glycoside hydrolase family 13 protein [Paenibacillus chartarius]|uniref:Glycoside hydrolase family 13 protein n=1 Tax=Paenibacillus chartarius TaxID=747481 RepID=A0ABV6DTQ3_9BACL